MQGAEDLGGGEGRVLEKDERRPHAVTGEAPPRPALMVVRIERSRSNGIGTKTKQPVERLCMFYSHICGQHGQLVVMHPHHVALHVAAKERHVFVTKIR